MKPKNFPSRKLLRQMKANGVDYWTPENQKKLQDARERRTKKNRG